MNQTFMKEKAALPLVLSMSLPMVLSMMANALYNIVDSFFVAQISEEAMTAISLVFPLQNTIMAVTVGFSIGINAVVAYFLGAGEFDGANQAATQGIFYNIIHGILLSIICISIVPSFLQSFTSDSEIVDFGIRYGNIAFAFAIVMSVSMAMEKIFQSVGKMFLTMICMLAGCVTNIILDPLMIFGIGPFPTLGIEGAAIATGIGQMVSAILYIFFYLRGSIHIKLSFKYLKPSKMIFYRLYYIGIPATLNLVLPSIMISFLNTILSAFSPVYVLVLGIYYKLQTFLYLPANGIVQGIRPIVGYNYGAKEYKRVHDVFKTSLILSIGIMVLGTALCLIIPEKIMGLFTENEYTIGIGARALRIISMGFIVSSISIIASGALEGLSKGVQSLVISLLRYIVLILPIAFVLTKNIGAEGVWYAFCVTELIAAILSYVIYKKTVRC